nr:hypothetical protein [Tanacetum cinerariifolium]
MLRAFPMSLTGAASLWLRNEPAGSITTWETLKEQFWSKYYPPDQIAKKMEEINNFQQDLDETLYQARILDSKGVIPSIKVINVKKAIQDMANHSYKWHNGTSTRFAVVENMDAYRAEEMGDTIIRKPLCKEACVKATRVTYQIEQARPRFKYLTNAQCNKMRPLLKVSTHDELKGISHPYQKLKGFYKEVLNLGLEYIKNEKVKEWLTCGHVSIHEME